MTESNLPPITSPTASVDIPALLAELASLKDDLHEMQRELQADRDRLRVEIAAEREEQADQARSGELGREWMTLQRRVDMGETTYEAIVRGEDDSPQAAVLQGYARANADLVAAELDAELEAAERGPVLGSEISPAAGAALESRALAAEVREQLARLQQLPLPSA